ncbi:MAG: HIT family protein [Cyclobacteriaceae bacterium]
MSSIFTKIIEREIPGHIVSESDDFIAFLDIEPLVEGHVLVVPKREVDYIFDLDDETLSGLHVFAKKVANGVDKAIPCQRVGVTVIGLEVPHAHIHLIPMTSMRDMDFNGPKMSPGQDELAATAEKIRAAIVD